MKRGIQVSVRTAWEWKDASPAPRTVSAPMRLRCRWPARHVRAGTWRFVDAAGVRLAQAVVTYDRFTRRIYKRVRRAQMIDSMTPHERPTSGMTGAVAMM